MATTAKVVLTSEQRKTLARDLRVLEEEIPLEVAVVAIAPEAGESLGLKVDASPRFSPALIIT